jgi:hypothetical protein
LSDSIQQIVARHSAISHREHMKRFGIFRKLEDGSRVFVGVNDDESTARTEAILLKELSGTDHLVFNLKTKIKKFDTGLYDRHLKKYGVSSRKAARKFL